VIESHDVHLIFNDRDKPAVARIDQELRNRGLLPATATFGEVGLSGEIRGIPQAALRIREAVQLGFTRIVLPAANVDPADREGTGSCELIGVRDVAEALDRLIA